MNYYVEALKKYADFGGRARRKEFWVFFAPSLIAYIAWMFIDAAMIGNATSGNAVTIADYIFYIYILIVLLPTLAVMVRRLHDTDRSAWWLLLGLVPVVGAIVLMIFAAVNGQPGANAYGTNPKGEGVSLSSGSNSPINVQKPSTPLRTVTTVMSILAFLGACINFTCVMFALAFCDDGPASKCINMFDMGYLLWFAAIALGVISLVMMDKKPKLVLFLSIVAALMGCVPFLIFFSS